MGRDRWIDVGVEQLEFADLDTPDEGQMVFRTGSQCTACFLMDLEIAGYDGGGITGQGQVVVPVGDAAGEVGSDGGKISQKLIISIYGGVAAVSDPGDVGR